MMQNNFRILNINGTLHKNEFVQIKIEQVAGINPLLLMKKAVKNGIEANRE